MQQVNLITVFLTGLLTGGLTCMAVQGGLLAATIAQREQARFRREATNGHALAILMFLLTKLIAYTILGALLGWLGSFFQISLTVQIVLQVIVVLFMLGTAGNLLQLHPLFRYFVIQPPRFITRLVRKESKSGDLFAPALLGALTIFIPCGTTQAMMALAVGTGRPLLGAAILSAFVLGTSPVFFLLGYFATKLGGIVHDNFMRFAAFAIFLLALFNLNATIALTGSSWTLTTPVQQAYCVFAVCDNAVAQLSPEAAVTSQLITINSKGYSPTHFAIKAGAPITLRLEAKENGGCAQYFTIPSLNIRQIVPLGESKTVTFTAPSKKGELAFMCGMGMYRGTMTVI